MTHDTHVRESVQDMTFVLAQDRIADLRASASAIDPEPVAPRAPATAGIVTRMRDAVGRRLIALGGSVVADEGLRKRALHL